MSNKTAFVMIKKWPESAYNINLEIISASQIVGSITVNCLEPGDLVALQLVGMLAPNDDEMIDRIAKIFKIEGFIVTDQQSNTLRAVKKIKS